MFIGMAGQRGVVWFNVELEVAAKPILVQEGHHCLGVIIILMAGRLLGFGFNQ